MNKCYSGDQVKEIVMGETCGTSGSGELSARVWRGILKKKRQFIDMRACNIYRFSTNDCVPVIFVYVQSDM